MIISGSLYIFLLAHSHGYSASPSIYACYYPYWQDAESSITVTVPYYLHCIGNYRFDGYIRLRFQVMDGFADITKVCMGYSRCFLCVHYLYRWVSPLSRDLKKILAFGIQLAFMVLYYPQWIGSHRCDAHVLPSVSNVCNILNHLSPVLITSTGSYDSFPRDLKKILALDNANQGNIRLGIWCNKFISPERRPRYNEKAYIHD